MFYVKCQLLDTDLLLEENAKTSHSKSNKDWNGYQHSNKWSHGYFFNKVLWHKKRKVKSLKP